MMRTSLPVEVSTLQVAVLSERRKPAQEERRRTSYSKGAVRVVFADAPPLSKDGF